MGATLQNLAIETSTSSPHLGAMPQVVDVILVPGHLHPHLVVASLPSLLTIPAKTLTSLVQLWLDMGDNHV